MAFSQNLQFSQNQSDLSPPVVFCFFSDFSVGQSGSRGAPQRGENSLWVHQFTVHITSASSFVVTVHHSCFNVIPNSAGSIFQLVAERRASPLLTGPTEHDRFGFHHKLKVKREALTAEGSLRFRLVWFHAVRHVEPQTTVLLLSSSGAQLRLLSAPQVSFVSDGKHCQPRFSAGPSKSKKHSLPRDCLTTGGKPATAGNGSSVFIPVEGKQFG